MHCWRWPSFIGGREASDTPAQSNGCRPKVRFAKWDGDDLRAAVEFNLSIPCQQFEGADDDWLTESLIFQVMEQIEAVLAEDGDDCLVERLKSAARRKLAGGDLAGFGSRHHTKESKERMAAATKAAWACPETRERILAGSRAGIARWKARQSELQQRKGDAQKT